MYKQFIEELYVIIIDFTLVMYIHGVMQVKLQIPKVILYVDNFVNKSFNILYIVLICVHYEKNLETIKNDYYSP